jgi:2-C-methyl-D-erythritol 4-phosphate cytidylyltransferase
LLTIVCFYSCAEYNFNTSFFIKWLFAKAHMQIIAVIVFILSLGFNQNNKVEKSVIVVAGGKGLRMGGEIPKQFFLLKGYPVIMRTIEKFTSVYKDIKVIVVLPENQIKYWELLCEEHQFKTIHQIGIGGETRFHSVKSGLNLVTEGIVAVHDAVRPLVSELTIKTCFQEAEKSGNAIPVVPINDSIRKVDGNVSSHVNRDYFKTVQTPQVFQTTLLKQAFQQGFQDSFTDDASVIEAKGVSVNLVPGNFENIKITRPVDLQMAEILLQ